MVTTHRVFGRGHATQSLILRLRPLGHFVEYLNNHWSINSVKHIGVVVLASPMHRRVQLTGRVEYDDAIFSFLSVRKIKSNLGTRWRSRDPANGRTVPKKKARVADAAPRAVGASLTARRIARTNDGSTERNGYSIVSISARKSNKPHTTRRANARRHP